jgi:hypothetical protein
LYVAEVAQKQREVALPRGEFCFPPVTWLVLAGLLVFLIGYPIFWLVLESLRVGDSAALTLENYARAVTTERFRVPALN